MKALSRVGQLAWVLFAFLSLMLVFSGVAWAAVSHWTVQAAPSLGPGDALNGVSCTSRTACVAVGHGQGGPLFAERWNGRAWSLQKLESPARKNSGLDAVSCPTRFVCTAVGTADNKVLVMQWNGKTWSIRHVPSPQKAQSELLGVSCPSKTDCFAVGNWTADNGKRNTYPLLERWNGSRWSMRPTAEPYGSVNQVELDSISCTSQTACTAVGVGGDNNADAVAERWNGKEWSVQKLRLANQGWDSLDNYDVSCASSSLCAAVGQAEAGMYDSFSYWSITEIWNGERWGHSFVTTGDFTPAGDGLYGVSCATTTSCLAVGNDVRRWDGRRWSSVRYPFTFNNYGYPNDQLTSVSCSSAASCEVVGSNTNMRGTTEPLAARWTS